MSKALGLFKHPGGEICSENSTKSVTTRRRWKKLRETIDLGPASKTFLWRENYVKQLITVALEEGIKYVK